MPSCSTIILGTGVHNPERILTNADLSKMVDTSDEWIRSRRGIRERRIAAVDESTSDMAVQAGRRALDDAGMKPSEIDLVIVATVTPDLVMPATACLVQQKLGIPNNAACFDLNAACSGFLYALDAACAMLSSGRYKKALIIGSEKLSSVVDWTDRATCLLFGDGAGAAVIGTSRQPGLGLIGTRLGVIAEDPSLLCIDSTDGMLKMKGKEVFKIAVRAMEEAARDILEQQGIGADQIDLVIPHQANLRIIEAIAQYLELPVNRFYVNLDRYGNTSAASIPIALDEAKRSGRIKPGDLTLLVAFGAGLTYGSALIRW